MKRIFCFIVLNLSMAYAGFGQTLVYHTIETDSSHKLIPWYSSNDGIAYDHCLGLIWNFWNNFPSTNGVKNYMTDHEYCGGQCSNKIAGDQFAMAMSSWSLYYAYTGDSSLISNMRYLADTFLAHSLSLPTDDWPNIPYPCNYGNNASNTYDGDYLLGTGYTQPDKAASFAAELITLYKITGDTSYLHAAIDIANTIADKVQAGSSGTSPIPFKVKASNGSIPLANTGWQYTGNVTSALNIFSELSAMHLGHTAKYDSGYNMIRSWVQQYPQQNNNWGCFFEDIQLPSNTETNAVTMAYYIMEHPGWSSTPLADARSILDWTMNTLGSHAYDTIGVRAIYEQTVDLKEGGSHTSRFASAELLYSLLSGDTSRVDQSIRQLNWATYLVDTSGQCRFSPQEASVWLTDGYGDFVRHFLRAMSSYPAIAPDDADHLLGSTSVITHISYQPQEIIYHTYDSSSYETLRLTAYPMAVKIDGIPAPPLSTLSAQGWQWTSYARGGVLKVRHDIGHTIDIATYPAAIAAVAPEAPLVILYPNPAHDRLTVKCGAKILADHKDLYIKLSDMTDRMIYMAPLSGTTTSVNVSSLSSGIYTAEVQDKDGSLISVKRVVKQ